MEHLYFDVLVVGSGAAGLRAAIAAREKGLEVCVISKAAPGKSTCTMVSGGVFAGTPVGASPEGHKARALQAGRGINQQGLVEILVQESRGAHFREDFPDQNDEKWRGHLQVRRSSTGELIWSFEAV